MASKRNVTRKGSDKDRRHKTLLYRVNHAKIEVRRLLRRNKAGTLTDAKLNRELKRVAATLKGVLDYTDTTLDEVSRLLQRNRVRPIPKGQMNIGLRKLKKRLWMLANFSDDPW